MPSSSRASLNQVLVAKPLSEPPAVREYEQLEGKTGRQALYRPDRFTLRDLVQHPERFTLRVDGRAVRPRNFSLSGLSFQDRQDTSWEAGATVAYSMELGGVQVLQGDANVARVQNTGRYVEVGLTSSAIVDYESLRSVEREQMWQDALRREHHIFRDALPSTYRQALLELAGFCQFYKTLLDRREHQNPGHTLEIAKEAFPAMQRGWIELSSRAAAPVLRRAYEKPLGYAGDYVVMQHYFANTFEGASSFGMVFHKITNEHPLSAGVRTRSEWIAELIRERAKRANGSGPLRVLSLGSGIGAEVGLVHSGADAESVPVRWTLIDQEDQALALAYRNALKIHANGVPAPAVTCVNVSFSQLFGGEIAPDTWGRQDVIFALGLFDYLPEPSASALIAGLYSLLREGGVVVIGNAAKPNSHFWEPELALRWSLLYRDREEMVRLGASLPSQATLHVGAEPLGAYRILTCQRS